MNQLVGVPPTDSLVTRHSDLILAALVVSVVAMMIVPLPTVVVDLLLSLNIALSIILLMVAVYVSDAMSIATFPTILLIATLFRLGLNVATTRLILSGADPGEVVRSFGSFVVADNLVVGVVVFLIITIIQFAVVARGSERVAEVAARFALDAMPGKQMAIDADVRAGLVDRGEARARRKALERESQLYGAMDGAMKFVKGDTVAAVLITIINLIGGLIVGIGYRDMSAGQAASLYSMLSIGDGLVAQLPALLLALAAGLIVTRVASEDGGAHLGRDIVSQVLAQPRAVAVAAILLLGLALVPGLPTVPFMTLGAICAVVAGRLSRRRRASRSAAHRKSAARANACRKIAEARLTLSSQPPIAVEIGQLEKTRPDDSIVHALDDVRRELCDKLGILVPPIEVRIESELTRGHYRLRIFGLAVDEAPAALPAATERIGRTLASHASEFVGMQEVRILVDHLGREHPALVREVVPALIGLPLLTEVVRRLVRERISIRDLPAIFHAMAQPNEVQGRLATDPAQLTERVRKALRRQITAQYAPDGALTAWLLDPMVEDALRTATARSQAGQVLALEPELAREILTSLRSAENNAGPKNSLAIVLAAPDIRRFAAEMVQDELPDMIVLAPDELLPTTKIDALGTVGVS
ncbi:MAG: flagellar biosynthesis protein FlhA [Proteobacteria bacterium]|nr:flagellar biosynthesis protein FlhA [Pseudomonadota bacterium]